MKKMFGDILSLQKKVIDVLTKLNAAETKIKDNFKCASDVPNRNERKRKYDNQWKANKRKVDRLRAKSEELYVKLSDSQVSTNLIDPELSGINQITELDQTSFDEIMTESKRSYNDALEFIVNSG